MAEEKKYIPYGLDEIDYEEFLTKSANEVLNYVAKLPWSSKRKQSFLNAYQDLMIKGITGASNTSGIWTINHNGDPVPLDTLSQRDREMYGEAAYFIQLQMSRIPTKSKEAEEEKEKKEKLPLFNNEFFVKDFHTYLGNKWFGGKKWDTKWWNEFDTRGENGLRGRTVRAKRLAETLLGYAESLKEGKYNFENSPFKDLNDLKARIELAVKALLTESPDDDRDALLQIGLDPDVYFYDGSADETTDAKGNPTTYGALYLKNLELAKARAAEELKKALAELNARRGILNPINGIHGTDAATNPEGYTEWISSQLGTGPLGYNQMNAAIQDILNRAEASGYKLDKDDKKRLGNFLYYIRANNPNYAKSNITDEEWKELNLFHNLGSTNRAGFVRLPWQTQKGRYTYADDKGNVYFLRPTNHLKFNAPAILRSAAYNNYKNNFLLNTKAGEKLALERYLNSTEFNDADIAELTGIGLDIASIVDPEPYSAGGLGVLAAGARNYARILLPEKWDIWDYGSLALDYVTGAIGAFPGLGDAALAYKVTKNIAKWGRRALTIPAVYDMLSHSPGALTAVKKAINEEDLTVEDYKNFGAFIRGFASTRRITVLNRAARRALEKRGYDLSTQNSWLKRSGLVDTSAPKLSTVKVNIKDKDGNIRSEEIALRNKKALDDKLKKAGNNQATKDKYIRENEDVIAYARNNNIKPEDISAVSSSSLRNARIGKYFGLFPKWARTTSENFGSSKISKPAGEDVFQSYLEGHRGLWDRYLYGNNKTLRGMDRLLGLGNTNNPLATPPVLDTPPTSKTSIPKPKLEPTEGKKLITDAKKTLKGKSYSKNSAKDKFIVEFGSKSIKDTPAAGGFSFSGKRNADGTYTIRTIENGFDSKLSAQVVSAENLKNEVRMMITRTILEANKLKMGISWKEIAKEIKEMKKAGYLKRGGQINKSSELIISDFINNLK